MFNQSVVLKRAGDLFQDEEGQDFMEYALLIAAVGAIALAVLGIFKREAIADWMHGINALRAARQ